MEILAEILHHLPPSQSSLQLWVMGKTNLAVPIAELRPDVQCLMEPPAGGGVDAVLLWHNEITPHQLAEAMQALREGGRLICWLENSTSDLPTVAQILEARGYVRILAEQVEEGMLARGEKPYTEGLSTLERVAVGAIEGTVGRYLHLLIKQTPNKPAWALHPDDVIQWEAVAIAEPLTLLAFTSLPKAVEFMQQAVLQGKVRDVSKIAKFSRTTVADWDLPLLVNPNLEAMQLALPFIFYSINPAEAESPDE